ncbi:MAG: DUF4252 domain-containing protein [Lewinellaceae bacterium]|nr:DUF4252 domain-containing protein [Lewinellaceae bacterium]
MLLRKLFFLGILVIGFSTAMAQTPAGDANAIDKYFKQYVEDSRFNVVYISPKLFQMLGRLNVSGLDLDDEGEAKAIMDIAKDLRGLRILSTDVTPDVFYKEAKAKINTKEYETLMTVRSKGDGNVDFLIREAENKIQELLLLTGGSGDEFLLLSFVGNLDLNKITQLAKEMEKK